MEKTTSEKLRLGIFMLVGSILFVTIIYIIGSKQQLFGNTEKIKAVFYNVNGLQIGNNVRYSGINVGTVKEISMLNDTAIIIEMAINRKSFQFIKKNANISIGTDGLVGNMVVNIVPNKGDSEPILPGDVLIGMKKVQADDMINTLSTTNSNAALLTSDLLKITNEIMHGQGTIGLLLNDKEVASDIKESIRELKYTSQATRKSIQSLESLIGSLDKKDNVVGLMKDTAVARHIVNIVFNLEKSTKKIDTVVQNLNLAVLNAKDGKGAINYLSNDPGLVKKIDTTMTNINESSKLLNENLEALKHNFLFRGYFKKRGKLKD
ncbi:MAG: MlaD family protein [Chitinophagales bacterium]|jgi:phospholipid/cholesterol/gamma-HCH transport system substrate-binding protein|nr:MlaD family protein [Sphingobacteriales bacterium]